ncbi:MAG TPA: HAMP domain-containing sensor histidine kinase [Rhizomicrobium sp.]|nr:HAMP domain-containing sensor histidine kinase [Rhizomicrobium sp.]
MQRIIALREEDRDDPRVLKAQLDLIARSVQATRITAPLWALAVSLVCSNPIGIFGHRPLGHVLFLPLAVVAATATAAAAAAVYQYATSHDPDCDLVRWAKVHCAMQLLVSVAWGALPWIFWESANSVNHVFIAVCAIAVGSALAAARGSNMAMFIAGLLPISVMTAVRFALGHSTLDHVIAFAAPFFTLHMWWAGRPLVIRMQEDSRLRFRVQDLARELEETRDDALRKRFEAEAANSSKTAFLANMSHELRTPLNAILGFSDIIARESFGLVGTPRYKDYARDIHASGTHLLSLINDLLDIAKIEAGRMEISPNPLDASALFEDALKLVAAKAAEKQQTLTVRVDQSCPALHADERALKQILINLVSNAVKYTPEGGHIEVTAERARDGCFQLMVRDDGPGIPREKLGRIFMPFSQLDNHYNRHSGGTGLGLALVKGLAELHGGRAWIESEQDQGCAAFVALPCKSPQRAATAA